MAQSAKIFATFKLKTAKNKCKINKIDENVDKLRDMHGNSVSQEAYFSPVFAKIPKIHIYPHPQGEGKCGQNILPLFKIRRNRWTGGKGQ